MKIGYARVSTFDQSEDAQVNALTAYGCERVYREKASGKSAKRAELSRLIDTLRPGDIVVVQRLDRLGRSLSDLIELLDGFKNQEVDFVSLHESIDTTTATGELVFHMIGAIAQFERRLISERTKVGLQAARARGRKGGRKAKLTSSDIKKAQAMLLDPAMTKAEVAKHFDVSRPTLNKALSAYVQQ
ncbi:recombinase family protein [Pseudoalteromonas ruthenica]|uniref:DNA invertase n=1 Tax=Pseudoalteromonas ruthenica TaxID=151081 RepID=A0A0F4Q1U2_9GAMM|nr:recombinase family protein [Pseudoalteromonas ruthenica]KJY97654.1 DNA invertase [Pseudoalteromonas ruthenica]KJZ01681.1 DNA invertase [Pseudoalteromonas ruthenica]TMO94924.1 recombinase family protein [Pseudoalteromonas ruthenica]TMO97051.1 recombinase family protein [Pseudoalteromonas ruthenica]TMP06423.1 recombinase family protein [Pseudoalteromonas ruthenica]